MRNRSYNSPCKRKNQSGREFALASLRRVTAPGEKNCASEGQELGV